MQEKNGERIAKLIARSGVCSRREAERLIQEGKVSVNGKIIESPALNVDGSEEIKVNGNLLAAKEKTRLWIFHKPAGCITSNKDPEGRQTIFDIMPSTLPRVVTVGRLDYNSEGLLLLTNDGGLAAFLESPKTGWKRKYRVRAFGRPDQKKLDKLEKGATINGVHYAPCQIELEKQQGGNCWFTVTLTEGKNREIRNMFEFAELSVNRLIRVAFGSFQLGNLDPGAVKEVTGKVLKEQIPNFFN